MKMYNYIKHNLKHIIISILDSVLSNYFLLKKRNSISYKIGIIKFDSIGDYILMRNYFPLIKSSNEYLNYKLCLIGSDYLKEVVQYLDKNIFDEFIWINKYEFNKNIFYKYYIISKVQNLNLNYIIYPSYSREKIADSIAKYSKCKHKIASFGDNFFIDHKEKSKANKYYTRLVPIKDRPIFEFERNKHFFEELLNKKINIQKPFINSNDIDSNDNLKPYIVFSISSGSKSRNWDILNFKELVSKIINTTNYNIYLTGFSQNDLIINGTNNRIFNVINKYNIKELICLIKGSTLLIGQDSAPIHIAAALEIPFVCISNGNHFKRFVPYPNNVYNKGSVIFPNKIFYKIEEEEKLAELYKNTSDLNINLISVEEVYRKVLELLLLPDKK